MRALLSVVLLAVALPAAAKVQIKVTDSGRTRTVRDLMVSALDEPSVQVAIGVTSTQRSLRDLRLSRQASDFAVDMMRATVRHNDEAGAAAFSTQLGLDSAKALFPFLAANQVAKLQRLAIARNPAAALGTNEVAFALGLSPIQRARIEALRAAKVKRASALNAPAMRVLNDGLTKAAALNPKTDEKDGEGNITVEAVDAMQRGLHVLFDAFERSTRLSDRQPAIAGPSPLAVLTPAQRRRLRGLASGALAKSPTLVAKRG